MKIFEKVGIIFIVLTFLANIGYVLIHWIVQININTVKFTVVNFKYDHDIRLNL